MGWETSIFFFVGCSTHVIYTNKPKGERKKENLKEIKRGSDKISGIKKRRMNQCKIIKFSNKMSQIGVEQS